jgi:lipopolysaccharide/colanic/teichoic acid biosynthesis glycosyltransferase
VDIALSAILVLATYIPFQVMRLFGWKPVPGGLAEGLLRLPGVLSGRLSLVGLPSLPEDPRRHAQERRSLYLGPPGVTGIVQINSRDGMMPEEIDTLKLYYAKNQSLGLDLEILLKAFLRRGKRS